MMMMYGVFLYNIMCKIPSIFYIFTVHNLNKIKKYDFKKTTKLLQIIFNMKILIMIVRLN